MSKSQEDKMKAEAIEQASAELSAADADYQAAKETSKLAAERRRNAIAAVIQAETANYGEFLASVEG